MEMLLCVQTTIVFRDILTRIGIAMGLLLFPIMADTAINQPLKTKAKYVD